MLLALLMVAALLGPFAHASSAGSQCTIAGTAASETLTGTPAADVICGMGGNDRLFGGAGDDTLLGGDGTDVLHGEDGADVLEGGALPDLLYGEAGADTLRGDEDTDYLDGGADADGLDGGTGDDTCAQGQGDQPVSCTAPNPSDPDDATGIGDVSRVTIGFVNGQPTWTFTTFASWTIAKIEDHLYFIVHIDSRGQDDSEYYAMIRSDGARLIGELYRDAATDEFMGTLDTAKPGGNTARISIPFSRVDVAPERLFVRWQARTLNVSTACPDICIDFIPQSAKLMRPLP
jgi:hypothetical protein